MGDAILPQTICRPMRSRQARKLSYSLSLGLMAGLVSSALALSAQAYDGAPGTEMSDNVALRIHPGYEPLGVNFGSFMLKPKLTLTAASDDNILSSSTHQISDTAYTLTPELLLKSQFKKHSLNLSLYGDINHYAKTDSENINTLHAKADWQIELGHDWTIDGQLIHNNLIEKRGLVVSSAALKPVTYRYEAFDFRLNKNLDDLNLTLGFTERKNDFDNNETIKGTGNLDQSYRNETDKIVSLTSSYRLSPNFALTGGAYFTARDYNNHLANKRDSKVTTLNVGTRFNASHLVVGEVSVGYIQQKFELATYKKVEGTSVRARVEWYPTRLTTVTFDASREDADPGIAQASSALVSQAGLRIDHELLRNLLISGQYRVYEYDYQGLDRKNLVHDLSLEADYLLTRRTALQMGYRHYKLSTSGTSPGNAYTNQRVTMGLVLKY